MFLRIFYESMVQAFQQLSGNKLRTLLSLLGITIGIWSIITVRSAVDSLEDNIRNSFEKLGNDVLYISKFAWSEDPSTNYWKVMRRPNPSFADFRAIRDQVQSASLVTYSLFIGGRNAEYRSSSAGAFCIGVTEDYAPIFNMEFDKGRFFSPAEYQAGSQQVILGYETAKALFGETDPLGKRVKLMGRKMTVIGVIKKSGQSLVNPLDFDECAIVSYELARRIFNADSKIFMTSLNVKTAEGYSIEELEDEVTGVLRSQRRLKPKEESNFAVNKLSILSGLLDSVFGVMHTAGTLIGLFAIIVGVVSVANIMFVSVKERTNIIGIKKALGAKRYVIQLEFLIEAVVLCLIGGLLGLFFVWLAAYAATALFGYAIYLSLANTIVGVLLAVATGIVSGIIPAIQASNMDPVEAIRA